MNNLLTRLKTEPWYLTPVSLASTIRMIESGKEQPRAQFGGESHALPLFGSTIENGIAVLPISGVMVRGWSWFGTDMREVEESLVLLAGRADVHTVIFAIDSPGGQAVGMPEIAELVREIAAQKRVVAWIDPVGCSAAYYLAAAADEVYSIGSAMVGSIGAVMAMMDSSKFWDEAGFHLEAFASAPGKLRGMQGRAFTDDDRAFFQSRVDEVGAKFAAFVKERRPAATEHVLTSGDYGQAETFGIRHGLVDATYTSFAHMFAAVFMGGRG